MTSLPNFTEIRRRPRQTAVALVLVMVLVLLAAGCAGGDCPQPLHTTTILKLDSNGTIKMEKVLDTGLSNSVQDLVPTSDGGFVTVGSIAKTHTRCTLDHQARIIRFSGKSGVGDIAWDRTIQDGAISNIIRMHDGGFAVLVNRNTIKRLGSEGKILWTNRTGFDLPYVHRVVIGETGDGGIVVAGPMFTKISPDGNIAWNRPDIRQSDYGFFSIREIDNGNKYLIFSRERINEIRKITLDNEGNLINTSQIFSNNNLIGYSLFDTPDGFQLLYTDESSNSTILNLDHEGRVTEQRMIDGSEYIIQAEDLGYFFIKKIPKKDDLPEVLAVRSYPNGTRAWNYTLPHYYGNQKIGQMIQTTDGAFVMVFVKDTLKDVSSLK